MLLLFHCNSTLNKKPHKSHFWNNAHIYYFSRLTISTYKTSTTRFAQSLYKPLTSTFWVYVMDIRPYAHFHYHFSVLVTFLSVHHVFFCCLQKSVNHISTFLKPCTHLYKQFRCWPSNYRQLDFQINRFTNAWEIAFRENPICCHTFFGYRADAFFDRFFTGTNLYNCKIFPKNHELVSIILYQCCGCVLT